MRLRAPYQKLIGRLLPCRSNWSKMMARSGAMPTPPPMNTISRSLSRARKLP